MLHWYGDARAEYSFPFPGQLERHDAEELWLRYYVVELIWSADTADLGHDLL